MTRDGYALHAALLALSTRLAPYLPREVAAATTATLLRTANAVAEMERERGAGMAQAAYDALEKQARARIAALEAEVDELRALERHVIESAIDDALRNGTRPIDQLWEDVNRDDK